MMDYSQVSHLAFNFNKYTDVAVSQIEHFIYNSKKSTFNVGFFGFGMISRYIFERLANGIVNDEKTLNFFVNDYFINSSNFNFFAEQDDVLKKADILIIGFDNITGVKDEYINEVFLSLIKKNCFIVNVSGTEIFDENAVKRNKVKFKKIVNIINKMTPLLQVEFDDLVSNIIIP